MKFSYVLCIIMLCCSRTIGQERAITWNLNKDSTITLKDSTTINLTNYNKGDSLLVGSDKIVLDTISYISIKQESSNSNIIVEYSNKKVEVESNANEVKIRYQKNDTQNINNPPTLTIKLEDRGNGKKNQAIDQTYPKNKKILDGIDCRYGEIKNLKVDFCKYLNSFSCDQLIVIDVAPYISGLSGIYSSDSKGNCTRKCCGVDICKNTKLLITNINPYLYTVSVTQAQTNIGPDMQPTDLSQPKENAAMHSLENTNVKYNKILLYTQAVIELKTFIECVKANTNPIEEVLENNKRIIDSILTEKKLLPIENIDSLYRILTDTIKIELKNIIKLQNYFHPFTMNSKIYHIP